MLLPGIGTINPIRPNQSHMVSLVGYGICGVCATSCGVCALSLGSLIIMSYWYLYRAVQLVLVSDSGRTDMRGSRVERIYPLGLGKLPTSLMVWPRTSAIPSVSNDIIPLFGRLQSYLCIVKVLLWGLPPWYEMWEIGCRQHVPSPEHSLSNPLLNEYTSSCIDHHQRGRMHHYYPFGFSSEEMHC